MIGALVSVLLTMEIASCILSPYEELLPDTLCSPVILSTPLPPLSDPADPALPAYLCKTDS